MANLAATIANRGYVYTPHLIKSAKNGKPLPQYQERHRTTIDSSYFKYVIDGMEDAVKHGTVWSKARIDNIAICGKTGTSQNKKGEKDHSVFVAFAPKENPKIALAVYVENAGFGGFAAAPIATLVIEKYLKKNIVRRNLADFMIQRDYMPKSKEAEIAEKNKKDSAAAARKLPPKIKPLQPLKPDTTRTKAIIVSNKSLLKNN
jgi:penicillin-binding protein 2